MFGDIAIKLIRLMGHSGTVPGAIGSEDIPEALQRLKTALAEEAVRDDEDCNEGQESSEDSEKKPVSLKTRAFPLIQLLEAAQSNNTPVMWDKM